MSKGYQTVGSVFPQADSRDPSLPIILPIAFLNFWTPELESRKAGQKGGVLLRLGFQDV